MAPKKGTPPPQKTAADKASISALRQISVNARQSLASSLCPKEQEEYELLIKEER